MAVDLTEQVDEYGRRALPETTVTDETVEVPVVYGPGSSLTLENGAPLVVDGTAEFNDAVDFTDATVTGLPATAFADLTGNISVGQMNAGASASSGTYWRGDGAWAAVPAVATSGAVVTRAAVQSILHNTVTNLLFDTEITDVGSCHSTGSNTDRLVAPAAGFYMVTLHVTFALNATGRRLIILETDAAVEIGRAENSPAGASEQGTLTVSSIVYLDAAAYVVAKVFQTSGGALDAGAGGVLPRFAFAALKPT